MRSEDSSTSRIIDLWTFKSAKSNKRYIVEVERFSNSFLGIKFYWKGVRLSKDRYSLLTNDFEPRRIIMSCIDIMITYFNNGYDVSFGFVAAPDLNEDGSVNHSINRRFRFYRNLMLTIFGSNTFIQAYDKQNAVYLLINRKKFEDGDISIETIEAELNRLYKGDFSIGTDSEGEFEAEE